MDSFGSRSTLRVGNHECFEKTKPLLLQEKNDQNVQAREAYAPEKRYVKDQVEGDR